MMPIYRHNGKCYIIHRDMPLHNFVNKEGIVDLELVKMCRDYFFRVDHVLRNDTHFLFAETIQDAEIIEEIQNMVEEAHS
jgi:hypothetical protein